MTQQKKNTQLPPMTEEQKKAAIARGFAMKFNSLAEGCLFALCRGAAYASDICPEDIADAAVQTTVAFMEKVGPACDAALEKVLKAEE